MTRRMPTGLPIRIAMRTVHVAEAGFGQRNAGVREGEQEQDALHGYCHQRANSLNVSWAVLGTSTNRPRSRGARGMNGTTGTSASAGCKPPR